MFQVNDSVGLDCKIQPGTILHQLPARRNRARGLQPTACFEPVIDPPVPGNKIDQVYFIAICEGNITGFSYYILSQIEGENIKIFFLNVKEKILYFVLFLSGYHNL